MEVQTGLPGKKVHLPLVTRRTSGARRCNAPPRGLHLGGAQCLPLPRRIL